MWKKKRVGLNSYSSALNPFAILANMNINIGRILYMQLILCVQNLKTEYQFTLVARLSLYIKLCSNIQPTYCKSLFFIN